MARKIVRIIKIIWAQSHNVLVNSPSQRLLYLDENFMPKNRTGLARDNIVSNKAASNHTDLGSTSISSSSENQMTLETQKQSVGYECELGNALVNEYSSTCFHSPR